MAKEFTDENFEKEVKEFQGVSLVDFWAPWCGPCIKMGPVIDEIAQKYEGKVNVGKVNVDENPELASEFGIRGIPSLVFIENGAVLGTINGFSTPAMITKKIEHLIQTKTTENGV